MIQSGRIRYRQVPVLVAMAEPGLLRRVRRESDDHAGEEGAAKEGTSAAHARNNVLCVSAPVCRPFPEHAGEVCEDVDDHQHAPGDEAQRVQSAQLAAMPDDDQRNAGSEGGQLTPMLWTSYSPLLSFTTRSTMPPG